MENQEEAFWKALLTNRGLRSRFIRDLELQAISSRSAEDLARRGRDEEMIHRQAFADQKSASSPSW